MTDLPNAAYKSHSRFSVVWLIPVICLAWVGWRAHRYASDHGPLITIRFPDGSDLVPKKTVIKYLGVDVGIIQNVSFDADKQSVVATARLDKSAAALARKGTTFVIVKPEFSFQGVRGLTTIFSGSYLLLREGNGDPADEFKGYVDGRSAELEDPGLILFVKAPNVASIKPFDPIFFRGVPVGIITTVEIAPNGQGVRVRLRVDYRYEQFIRKNTVFWEAGGLHAKLGLFSSKVSLDSIDALLRGGISFATPNEPGPPATAGTTFALQPTAPPDEEKWTPKL